MQLDIVTFIFISLLIYNELSSYVDLLHFVHIEGVAFYKTTYHANEKPLNQHSSSIAFCRADGYI